MKKSNKILLGTAVAIFIGLPIAMGVSAINAKADTTSNFKNFQHIILKGTWDARIMAGDHYQVTITTPSIVSSEYSAMQNGDTVIISNVNARSQNHFTAIITLPQLTNLELRGANTTSLSDFRLKDLSLSLSGDNSLTGADNEIQNLKLYAAGTSKIDLTDTKTTNVNLDIAGANNTKLNMQGGNLTGQVRGTVSISYLGSVKTQNIDTRGTSKVEKLNT